MSVMAFCCALGALLRDNVLMSAFCLCFVTYIIDLVMSTRLKLVTELLCLCSTSEKVITVFGFLRFLLPHFFARVARGHSRILMKGARNTHGTCLIVGNDDNCKGH